MFGHLTILFKNWHWPALSIAASIFMLAMAHGFERFAMLAPCPLCLRQRDVYWTIIAVAALILIMLRLRPRNLAVILGNTTLGIIFLTGLILIVISLPGLPRRGRQPVQDPGPYVSQPRIDGPSLA